MEEIIAGASLVREPLCVSRLVSKYSQPILIENNDFAMILRHKSALAHSHRTRLAPAYVPIEKQQPK